MLKVMKYEFRKQLFSKFIMLGIFGVVELVFLFCVFFDKSMGLPVFLLVFAGMGAYFFIAFESVFTYSRDLKTKQSYMLFLIPRSTYSIMGAKILAGLIQIILATVIYFLLIFIDVGIVMARYGGVKELVDAVLNFFKTFMEMDLKLEYVVIPTILAILEWFLAIIAAMLSITLSTTVLSNKKIKGVVSVLLFFVIIYLSVKLLLFIHPGAMNMDMARMLFLCAIMFLEGFIMYVATAWMLDEKVSV